MTSSQRIPPMAISCIFIEAIQPALHLRKGMVYTKKVTNNAIERRAWNQKIDVPHINLRNFNFCNFIFILYWLLMKL